ncbi:transposase [Spiribacter halobius]|uniref:transposase n=1 Tax=Sediminicurvatus halobius TaxID=2182432 RepID=UPI003F71D279
MRNGTRLGLQRWLCRDCGRSCTATIGTALSRLRGKHKSETYARCLDQGMTVREAAEEVGQFRWPLTPPQRADARCPSKAPAAGPGFMLRMEWPRGDTNQRGVERR